MMVNDLLRHEMVALSNFRLPRIIVAILPASDGSTALCCTPGLAVAPVHSGHTELLRTPGLSDEAASA